MHTVFLAFDLTFFIIMVLFTFVLFKAFLRGETQIPTDEAFQAAVIHYQDVFLKSERIAQIVAGGALSQNDCREVFR